MELKFGIETLESYKRLSYKVWYALAEFVDNSTQSYRNNKAALEQVYKKEKTILTVKVSYSNNKKDKFIQIEDNSIGMNESDLVNALTIGKKPRITSGRSRYGMGLKTAAFWFGDKWEIITKKYDDENEYHVVVDLDEIIKKHEKAVKEGKADKSNVLKLAKRRKDKKEHYTIIKITKLNQSIQTKTASKTKDYLRSIYRYDLMNGRFGLFFQSEQLKWSKEELMKKLLKDDDGIPYYKKFEFEVKSKKVSGWAGILAKGKRGDAGFSLLQAERVIQGWPAGYRPEKLFGDQEGGRNDLVNQRLFGELFLDGFDVSHTKDEILFKDDQEDILDEKLFEKLAHYKKVANEPFKTKDEQGEEEIDFGPMVNDLFNRLESKKFVSTFNDTNVIPSEVITKSNDELFQRVIKAHIKDRYTAKIAGVTVVVIINSDGSVYDPYLLIRIRAKEDMLGIIINKNHPYWKTMAQAETTLHFVEHCVFDGLSEWKAHRVGSMEPDTIKMIKDSFLRQDLLLY